MKYRCFAALALAMLLPGCAAAPDLTPVWQRDLPASGVHIELSNAALLSDADVYYAAITAQNTPYIPQTPTLTKLYGHQQMSLLQKLRMGCYMREKKEQLK